MLCSLINCRDVINDINRAYAANAWTRSLLAYVTEPTPWQLTPCHPKSNCCLLLPSLKAWWLLSVARILHVLTSFSMPIVLYDCWWKKVNRDPKIAHCKISCFWYPSGQYIILCAIGLNHLPVIDKIVQTPTGTDYQGIDFEGRICGVSIMRAGESMEQGLRDCCRQVEYIKSKRTSEMFMFILVIIVSLGVCVLARYWSNEMRKRTNQRWDDDAWFSYCHTHTQQSPLLLSQTLLT